MLVVASAGLRRDQVVAACLAGAVVVVVGYASGIGLKTTVATGPAASDQAPAQAVPAPQQPPPNGELPPMASVPPMPPMPDGGPPPGDLPAAPVADAPTSDVAVPTMENPQPSGDPVPPGTPPQTPPSTTAPTCQPGAVQPVLDTAGGLPLVGGLTAGAGVTGPNGLLATLIGFCPTAPGTPAQLPGAVPLPPAATASAAIPASGG
ncbi:hypothetical protein [Amycolatopsis benzoatilytica]|uniref:hypothetical protein n=1 Tax=Amycolatopsis benzoatilytica TaxID=346045 RepID=UPI000557F9B1|nr:hypothetical protein [Amycolatopsis benzoatilytica]